MRKSFYTVNFRLSPVSSNDIFYLILLFDNQLKLNQTNFILFIKQDYMYKESE